jgi:hypothetical protein
MSEHREHLLPDAEDISCRGAPIVGPRAGLRQRIYRRRGGGTPRSGQRTVGVAWGLACWDGMLGR